MKKSFVRLSLLLITAVFFHYFSTAAEAKIYSYKLFDPMTVPQPAMVAGGRVAWWTRYDFGVGIMNRRGKMVISKNPDGTGNARVGDTLQVWANNPYHGSYIFTYNAHRRNCFFEDPPAMPPQDISSYFPVMYDPYEVTVRILDWCGKEKYTDSLYLVNITTEPENAPSVTPTPTPVPSATPTPTPAPVKPFLELPWDYAGRGLSFTDAALRIEAFFDHEFPLLSAGAKESDAVNNTIVKYDGTRSLEAYSSHDGYDYARRAGATLGAPVLAAAAGTATYTASCRSCGNMILVDHGNGFQTRYMHLLKDGLITAATDKPVTVVAGQQIGKVGFTGNVLPPGDMGAHIHFMVVEDKNRNGRFDDNIPNGVTDPFGWTAQTPDPWETSGNKSRYLWKNKLDSVSKSVKPEQSEVVSLPAFTVTLPVGTYNQTYLVQADPTTYSGNNKSLASVGNAFLLSAYNEANALITQFRKAFTIEIKFKKTDVALVKSRTLSIYSSQDGQTWQKENTTVNLAAGIARTSVDHMTYFALLGERNDTQTPTTVGRLKGKAGEEGWFRSDVTVSLTAKDSEKGSGVDYIAYQLDGGERSHYKSPVTVKGDGAHVITYFSADKDGNIESEQSLEFNIDTKAPAARIYFDPAKSELVAEPTDKVEKITVSVKKSKERQTVTLVDRAGNKFTFTGSWKFSPPIGV